MKPRARASLSRRLMGLMLVTTATALVAAGAALLFIDLRNSQAAWATDLETEAAILSLAVQPALSFEDFDGALRNVNALQARESIQAAALYTANDALFVAYARTAEAAAPARAPELAPGVHVNGGRMEFIKSVVQDSEKLGTIYLKAQHDVRGRVVAYLSVLGSVMLIGLAAALLVSSWLQRTVSQPMESMARAARQIVEKRDYSFRANKTTDDEVGVVIDAFDNMLDEVESRAQALETSEKLYRAIGESINYGVWICDADGRNVYVSDSLLRLVGMTSEEANRFGWLQVLHPDDVDETAKAWKACIRTGDVWYREHRMLGVDGRYHAILAQGVPIRDSSGNVERWAGINLDISRLKSTEDALRDADRRKDEFLATLAHELRNPLAPILNAVRILDSDAASVSQRKWGREVIARQAHRMSLLLDDLLDVSRITRGQLELKKEHVDLVSLVDVAVETARPLLESKQHQLFVNLPDERIMLEVDSLRLSQVIANLLTNAAKYTDANGRIELEARRENAELAIVVRDNGIGLPENAIPGLFTMFSQLNSEVDRTEGGLGIGLALVKGLVTLHGGRVEARSDGLGRGSEFIVRLPGNVILPLHLAAKEECVDHTRNTGQRISVLVVDDNRDAAESLGMALSFTGYHVSIAFDGIAALEIGARERPRAAIVDIGMPRMSGYEVARRIRRQAWGRHIALIALTGWGQEEDRRTARTSGFDIHLTKPVDPDSLGGVLAKLLSRDPACVLVANAADVARDRSDSPGPEKRSAE